MGQNGSVHGALVYEVHGLSGQIVQAVQIHRLLPDLDFLPGGLHVENRLEHDPRAVLDKLSHGVQVCSQIHAGREDSFLVLALALAVELLPPLGDIVYRRLIVGQDLHALALAQQDVAQRRILQGVIALEIVLQSALTSAGCTLHELVDIRAADRNG